MTERFRVVKFSEYDATKHRLPIAETHIKAGDLVGVWQHDAKVSQTDAQLASGVAQHDCEPHQPITVLTSKDTQYDSLWVITDD